MKFWFVIIYGIISSLLVIGTCISSAFTAFSGLGVTGGVVDCVGVIGDDGIVGVICCGAFGLGCGAVDCIGGVLRLDCIGCPPCCTYHGCVPHGVLICGVFTTDVGLTAGVDMLPATGVIGAYGLCRGVKLAGVLVGLLLTFFFPNMD